MRAFAFLLLAFSSCTSSQTKAEQADVRMICDQFMAWEQDEEFMALEREEKLAMVIELITDEVKTPGVRETLLIQTTPAEVNRAYYNFAPKGFRCPAFDRTYPAE